MALCFKPDQDGNVTMYGSDAHSEDILNGKMPAPHEVADLLAEITKYALVKLITVRLLPEMEKQPKRCLHNESLSLRFLSLLRGGSCIALERFGRTALGDSAGS